MNSSQLLNSLPPVMRKAINNPELIKHEKARRSFWEYRTLINPKMKIGWFQKETADHLQEFYESMCRGERPKLVIEAPPQHGKSIQVIDFISWVAGKQPDWKTIFTSFSERLGIRANLRLQRLYDSELYHQIFDTRINGGGTALSGQCLRNREILEYKGDEGFFRNTTVRGSITGESLDLGVIDDPMKGRETANSKTVRNSTWDWFTDDFFTRFSEEAALLIILTRWHIDDVVGRLLDHDPEGVKVLKYKAIATEDEENRKEGDVLFPEHKSLDFLLERKKLLGSPGFEALYQQSPFVEGGTIIKEEWFKWYGVLRKYKRIVISWDTGFKTEELNDPSAATVWGEHDAGYDLLDVFRKKLAYPALKQAIIDLATKWTADKYMFTGSVMLVTLIEDKASGQSLLQDLKANTMLSLVGINPKTDKVTRVSTCSPLIEAGKVYLKTSAPWLDDYLAEIVTFPFATHDDQVDSTSQFLNWVSSDSTGRFTELFF